MNKFLRNTLLLLVVVIFLPGCSTAPKSAAKRQTLGLDEGEASLQLAEKEVNQLLVNTWRLYQSSPSPKSLEVKRLLVEGICEAQFVGLESPVVDSMTAELDRLWDELLYVNQEPIALTVVFEQIYEFATQDRPDLVKAPYSGNARCGRRCRQDIS